MVEDTWNIVRNQKETKKVKTEANMLTTTGNCLESVKIGEEQSPVGRICEK